jgi:hypothetical protein
VSLRTTSQLRWDVVKKTKICEQQITQEIMWDAIFRAVLYF